MRNHTLDAVKIHVGRGVCVGQNIAAVKNVQPLILHRAHVEITDRHDVEHRQIIFAAIDLLIPGHAVFQRLHGMASARQIPIPHPNGERHLFAGHGGKMILIGNQIPRHQCEQIARLWPWVVPLGKMPSAGQITPRRLLPIGEQDGEGGGIPIHPHGIDRHIVRSINKGDDPAEPLCLALGAQHPVGREQPHQLRIGAGVNRGGKRNDSRITTDWHDDLPRRTGPTRRLAIDRQGVWQCPILIKPQGPIMCAIAPHRHGCGNNCAVDRQVKFEPDGINQPVWRQIITAKDGDGGERGRCIRHGQRGRSGRRSVQCQDGGAAKSERAPPIAGQGGDNGCNPC